LREHRHHPVHPAIPQGNPLGGSGDLREDLADYLHQGSEDTDPDPARRHRSAGAAPGCLRAVSRTQGHGCAHQADRVSRVRGGRPWPLATQVEPSGDAAQPGVVRPVLVGEGRVAADRGMTLRISGITPFFIVADVPATLTFYRDMLGFEVVFRGPTPEDEFFGIVRRDGATIMFKALV